jgi:hypothetical protein
VDLPPKSAENKLFGGSYRRIFGWPDFFRQIFSGDIFSAAAA